MKKLGVIICHRYHTCAGGKCLRALESREGAFSLYEGEDVQLVGYTTCDGCPGGNVEYAPAEMKRNGVDVIHLATGLLVGYPPCPYIDDFVSFIKNRYATDVVLGTHPIPQKYIETHEALGTWDAPVWRGRLQQVMADQSTRLRYD
jgi:predicted metal-binding protein